MRYEAFKQRLVDAVIETPGDTTPVLRRAALERAKRPGGPRHADIPAPLAAYIDKVARHAYKVTDDDVAALRAAGYSEDQIFEATVGCALGACLHRLDAGLQAIAGEQHAA